MKPIYHIASRAAWEDAQQQGRYTAPSLASEGFIHCSRADQVLRVANAFYAAQAGLVILEIDTAHLMPELRWEPPAHPTGNAPTTISDADLFPHLYGPLNPDAVTAVHDFPPNPDGTFTFPASLITSQSS